MYNFYTLSIKNNVFIPCLLVHGVVHVGHVTEFAGFQVVICRHSCFEVCRAEKSNKTVTIKEFYHIICNVIHKILKQK